MFSIGRQCCRVVLIDQICGQQRDRFETVMENVPSPKKRRKVWLESLVGFRLSPGLAVGVEAPLGFLGSVSATC